jgi:predicted transposase YdaD
MAVRLRLSSSMAVLMASGPWLGFRRSSAACRRGIKTTSRADPGFHHRLAAQTFRFLQLHPRIEHWRVVVITPHRRLSLGPVTPLRSFLEQVHWVSLDELGQQDNLDAAIDLLTLPVRPEPELGERCRRILESRQDLEPVVFSMLFERFPCSAERRS